MRKKHFFNFVILAMLATFVTFTACKDYDDDIKTLETELGSLSSSVAEMQQKIEKGGATITGVETTANGVIIKLSDGKTYTLTNGANGKDGSLITLGENGNWFVDGKDSGKASKGADGKDGIYYTPGEDGFWHKVDGEINTPTTDSWIIEGTITAKWEDGYVVLYNVEGSDGPITLGLVGMNNLVLIPDFVTDGGNPAPALNFSSLMTPCGEIAPATALVRYQVSPTNASESLIDKDNLYFKYNTPQVLTRSPELNPKAEFVSLENGVLTVRASINTEVLEEIEDDGKITQLMLIVPSSSGDEVVSDWATVVSTPVEDISLVRVPTEVEDIDWSEYKLVETLDEAKALAETSPTVVDIEFGETVDLLQVVKTMFSEDSPWRDFDIDGYNLEYAFDLKDEEGADIVYDHQQFLKLEGSVVSAVVAEGPDVRTPIVHVILKAKDEAHECNVLEGFIKINIVGEAVVDPVLPDGLAMVRVPADVEGIVWSEYKLVETLDEAKALEVADLTVVDLEHDQTLDLLEVVKTMLSEESPWVDFDIDDFNLVYAFDLNDEEGNEIVYDHQEFLNLEGSIVSAVVLDGPAVRTPIVHVMLKSEDEATVVEGFIKINIVGIEVEPNQVQDIDGNVYTTVKIGEQTWMVENYKSTRYRDGSSISAGDLLQGHEEYIDKYGQLYSGHAVKDPSNLAPEGWRVATAEDWLTLANAVGGMAEAGGKLKDIDAWDSPNTGATNEFGFTALPGGLTAGDTPTSFGHTGVWWSTSDSNAPELWRFAMIHDGPQMLQISNDRSLKFSVRLIKEEEVVEPDPVQDIDGNVYTTVKIGGQTWMGENLKVTHYKNGDPIERINDDVEWGDVTGKYGAYLNNDDIAAVAGYLYNWHALTDSRNIAPEGWRVPTEDDWTNLVNYLGGEAVAGGKLKSTDPLHWAEPNTGATNSSGFTAVGGGVAHVNVPGANLTVQGIYWSSSDVNPTTGLIRIMEHNHTQAIYSGANKKNGYSVRLIKDE